MIQRHCFTLTVRPGQEAEYRRLHDELWPELAQAQREAGIRDFALFMRGREVIGTFVCEGPDPAAALARLDALDVSKRWDELMETVIESFGETPVEVWHLGA